MLGRIQVETHNVPHLLDQERIGRQLERLGPMRLQAERVPDAADRHAAQARRVRHPAQAPVSLAARRGLQGADHHAFDVRVGNRPRRPRAGFIVQTVEPVADKAAPPLPDGLRPRVQSPRNPGAGQPLATQQDDPRPPRQVRSRPGSGRQRFQALALRLRQHERSLRSPCTHALPPFVEQTHKGRHLFRFLQGQDT
jgi:hypothetical protein